MSLKPEEYEFLTTGTLNASASAQEYCYEQGYFDGWHKDLRPRLTRKGFEAVKAFQANQSYRWDVI